MALSAFVRKSRETLGDKGKGPQRSKAWREAVDAGKGLPKPDAPKEVIMEWLIALFSSQGRLMSPDNARKVYTAESEDFTPQAMPSIATIRAKLAKRASEAKASEAKAKASEAKASEAKASKAKASEAKAKPTKAKPTKAKAKPTKAKASEATSQA